VNELKEYLNKVTEGDAVESMKRLPAGCIDLIVTDPPYEFVSKRPVGGGFMENENRRHLLKIKSTFGLSFDPFPMLEAFLRICRKFNAYIFTNKELIPDYLNFARKHNFKYDILILAKRNPLPLFNRHYLLDKEYVIFLRKKGAFFNSTFSYDLYRTIYDGVATKNDYDHPTQKPLGFISKMIKVSSAPGHIILDPYLGTGTTAIAAEDLEREWIGFDDDPKSCLIAQKRLEIERSRLRLPIILSPNKQELKGEQHELHLG
jgi:DNA modification methylase